MDGASWQRMREAMPIARKWAYFDHAAVAPLPAPTQQTVVRWSTQAAEAGGTIWTQWRQEVEVLRNTAAELIGARDSEIAIVANTTAGINIIADALPWQRGDNVVTFANEFPSNQYPWMNLSEQGVELRRVPFEWQDADPLEALALACDARTKLIAISWVGYGTGYRLDLGRVVELARHHGAFTFVDAIQGLGVFPIDAENIGIDFLAADGHKWMLGPEGAGLLYIRDSQLDKLRPTAIGWNSVTQGHDFATIALDLVPTAARFEGGSHNMVGLHGLSASLQFLRTHGLKCDQSVIAERLLDYVEQIAGQLQSLGADVWLHPRESRSGILSFVLPGRDPRNLRRACMKKHVAINCRDGRVRLSPHAYNNDDDLSRLLDVIQSTD